MPNRVKRTSVVDMLAKVPVNRGSLLQSIENLLKTIESSENAVMIPTLLRDKCEFDAWELLFVAKILKASILGHSDLVEFYMNHIGHSSNQFSQPANGHSQTTSNGGQQFSASGSTTGSYEASASQSLQGQQALLSPSQTTFLMALNRQPASPIASSSPMGMNGLHSAFIEATQQQQQSNQNSPQMLSPLPSSNLANKLPQGQSGGKVTWSNQDSLDPLEGSEMSSIITVQNPNQALLDNQQVAGIGDYPLARPLNVRLAQPPSLLQLTTTNNHINSVAQAAANVGSPSNGICNSSSIGGTNTNASGSSTSASITTTDSTDNNENSGSISTNIEQITQELMQINGNLIGGGPSVPPSTDSALSISTATANQQSANNRTPTATSPLSSSLQATPAGTPSSLSGHHLQRSEASSTINQHYQQHMPELRTSRSAGCLFRANSGASSPRTPLQTPSSGIYPQAETLAASNQRLLDGLSGDPKVPVRLLLQIEQLKSSISHVTNLLESVVELYKKSIDEIA